MKTISLILIVSIFELSIKFILSVKLSQCHNRIMRQPIDLSFYKRPIVNYENTKLPLEELSHINDKVKYKQPEIKYYNEQIYQEDNNIYTHNYSQMNQNQEVEINEKESIKAET